MDPTKKLLQLTDGTSIEIKVNFATIYRMNEIGMISDGDVNVSDEDDPIDTMAKLVYVILTSNGRRVTFDDAIELMPIDETAIQEAMEEFQAQMQKFNKKKLASQGMKQHIKAM